MYRLSKRVFDTTCAAVGLVVLSPVLAVLAVLIKLDSRGPVLYRAPRVGRGGVVFRMAKFRTMVERADQIGGSSTPDNDPRITRVGRFLRKYKLDELPQLINVIKGEMSFVGPRPQVQWAVDLYTPQERGVLSVPPGITDYASLRFPNEGEILKDSTDPDKDYMEKIHPEKMRLSLKYVEERSLWLDLKIIVRTIADHRPPQRGAAGVKKFRTQIELEVSRNMVDLFQACPDTIDAKLDNFPKYVRRQSLKRFLALYEIFKQAMPIKGSIVECGVFKGFGVMSWAKLSAMLEPENFTRRVYGFDTFEGFASISEHDRNAVANPEPRALLANSLEELQQILVEYDKDRFLGHMPKVQLIAGDAVETIPRFVQENPHLVVSLLFLDFDLFEPTKMALETFVPRMPKGAIIAFDELDNPMWPGETMALLSTLGISRLRLERLEWDPYIGFARLE